jgi:Flp pilus assembly pilin Flp
MNAITKKQIRKARGQGMTEYIIIVALIAIAAVGVVTLFGNNIRKMFGASANVLAGKETGNDRKESNQSLNSKKIANFDQNNTSDF